MIRQGPIAKDHSPVLYLAGPGIVGELLHQFLAERQKYALAKEKRSHDYEPVRKLTDALERTRAAVLMEVTRAHDDQLTSADIGALCHVVSSNGRDFGRETIGLDGHERELAVALLNEWGERLLAEPAPRSDLASLTWAMRRLPDASEVPVVDRMLRYELSERRKLRAAYEADNRNAAALNAWRNSHEHEYRTLLTTIGTWDAHDVFAGLLSDPDFGSEAAFGMQIIWQETNDPQPPERFSSRFPDFDRVAKAKAQGWSVLSETAALLLTEARSSAALGTPASRNRAATMAGCAVLLPHGEQGEFLFGLLQGGLAPRVQLDLGRRMILGGYILQSSMILDSISSLIAERNPNWRWLNDNDGWELFDWVALLPASDDPASLIRGVELLFDLDFYTPSNPTRTHRCTSFYLEILTI